MSVKIVTKQAETESVELYQTCGNGIAIVVRDGTSHHGTKTCLHEKEARKLRLELDNLIAEEWPTPSPVVITRGGAYILTGLPNITVTLKE